MADVPDPPRKFYDLKPRDFERVNAAVPAERMVQGLTPSSGETGDSSAPLDVREMIRQSASHGPVLRGHAAARSNQPNDVHAVLLDNLARANTAGLNDVAPPTRPCRRRRRDYWVLFFGGNTFIGGLYAAELFFGFQVQCMAAQMPNEFENLVRFALQNPASYAMGLVGMVFFTLCLTWLMYGVMDNY